MSVRINLLPQEATQRQAVARQRRAFAAGGVLLVAALGATTVWQDGRVDEAETRLAGEQAVLVSLQGEVQQLEEFAELDRRSEQSQTLIVQAMGLEASVAGILQDVAAVMPSDAEFESLTLAIAPQSPVPGIEAPSIGTLTATGRSASAHAPGVERLLLDFDKVAGFHDPFVASTALDDPEGGYPQFSLETQLGPEILTGRYVNGNAEELR